MFRINDAVIIQWLEEDFMKYLTEWEDSVMRREDFTLPQKRMMCLSQETLEGLKMTSKRVMDLRVKTNLSL